MKCPWLLLCLFPALAFAQSESTRWTHHQPRDVKVHARNMTMEIGDTTKASIDPSFRLSGWDDEVGLRMRLVSRHDSMKSFTRTVTTRNGKPRVRMATSKVTHDMYFKSEGAGAFEWGMIFHERPDTNVWNFRFQSKGLTFYYQPVVMDSFQNAQGWVRERPDSVNGSYAVYHSSRANVMHRRDGTIEDYGSGKFTHIYRPTFTDGDGRRVFGTIQIDTINGRVKIVCPPAFRRNAPLPITLGPSFGYSAEPSSVRSYSDWKHLCMIGVATASLRLVGANQTLDSLRMWITPNGDDDSFWVAIYKIVSDEYTDLEHLDTLTISGGGAAKWTQEPNDQTSFTFATGTTYGIASSAMDNEFQGLNYDTGGTADGSIFEHASRTQPPDPFGTWGTNNTHKYAMVGVFTEGAGATRRRHLLLRMQGNFDNPLSELIQCVTSFDH